MLKKFLVMFGMVAAFVGNAGAEAVTPKQETTGDKCYLIGTADELDGFAKNVAATGFTGCAKLTADIHYQRSNGSILNAERNGLLYTDKVPTYEWTPLQNFSGTFDGQGHTIYGLYASSKSEPVGFIANADGATIQNLHITDSYFAAETEGCTGNGNNITCKNVAAGFVALVSGSLTFEKCGFSGVVDGVSRFIGGLVGATVKDVKIFINNSYNEGFVKNGAGLVGTFLMKTVINVVNSYNTGVTAAGSPLIGATAGKSGNLAVSGNNIGCIAVEPKSCEQNFTGSTGITYPGVSADDVFYNYWTNLYGNPSSSDESGESSPAVCAADDNDCLTKCNDNTDCIKLYNQIYELKGAGMTGVTIEPVEKKSCQTGGECKSVYVLVLLDLDDPAVKFKMPAKLNVVEVNYQSRKFNPSPDCENATSNSTNLPFSTTVLPFSMDVTKIHGAKFFYPVTLAPNEEDAYWHVGVREVSGSVQAHTPYLVCPTADQLTFDVATDVEMTDESNANATTFTREGYTSEVWKLQGLYERTCFKYADDYKCFDDGNEFVSVGNRAGRVYAFSGGVFFRAVNGMSNIFRAYILAPEEMGPVEHPKSQMPGMMRAPSALSISEDVPSQMTVKILGSDADLISWVKPVIIPDTSATSGENGEEEEGTTVVKQPLIFPVHKNNASTWYDMKGRNAKRKPSAKGVYLNNGVPAVVK